MKSSIIGFPRIGDLRQLKFLIESYFDKEIGEEELLEGAHRLKVGQWEYLKSTGLDFIPSGDFSLYDNMLDAAFMVNIIPERYKVLESGLQQYFAMARGFQEEGRDLKALPMKKWFNTNYHYIVPEIDDNTDIRLVGTKLFDEYKEAKESGVTTRPTLIGPFTLLMLCDYKGSKTSGDFVDEITKAYVDIISSLKSMGAKWLQLDEPFLVTDLTEDDRQTFKDIYTKLLKEKRDIKVLLQTYFGDIRDIYDTVCSMGFDAIGLDFVEGTRTLDLIESQGFPANTQLVAGIINGKNIWKNDYKRSIELLDRLASRVKGENLIIGTSCSLLLVPYTLEHETLNDEYKEQFSFASQKLIELEDLKRVFSTDQRESDPAYIQNTKVISNRGKLKNPDVRQKVADLREEDFVRKDDFYDRREVQRKALSLPVLPTTTIGSFPQTPEVKANRARLRKGEITHREYKEQVKEKIAFVIELQEEIGLDVLVHGEYERNDMVEHFGENLDGFIFTDKAWVQSYGTRCVNPPIIWGDISRRAPITIEYSEYAQSLTTKPVKGMLTGPVTILNWSFPREDMAAKEMAFQIALAIKEEVQDLEKAGIRVIQIDEAALKEKLPIRKNEWHSEYLDWAIPAFRLVHSGVKAETQIHTHMCYSEFDEIITDIDNMDADVISFEASRSNLLIVDTLKKAGFKTQVGPGVYDIHSPRIPSQEEIYKALKKMIFDKKLDKSNLWVNPDCGLKTRGETETIPSLVNMVKAAKKLREEL